MRNTLRKSGTFLLVHPVYICVYIYISVSVSFDTKEHQYTFRTASYSMSHSHTAICYIAISKNTAAINSSVCVMLHKGASVHISYCQLQQVTQPHCNMLHNYQQHTAVIYTGCPRRNVPDFGRVFLMLNYTDITQSTCIQSSTVTEIIAREKCGLHQSQRTVRCSWRHTCPMRLPGN